MVISFAVPLGDPNERHSSICDTCARTHSIIGRYPDPPGHRRAGKAGHACRVLSAYRRVEAGQFAELLRPLWTTSAGSADRNQRVCLIARSRPHLCSSSPYSANREVGLRRFLLLTEWREDAPFSQVGEEVCEHVFCVDAVVKTRATRFDGARNIIEFAVENKISESP